VKPGKGWVKAGREGWKRDKAALDDAVKASEAGEVVQIDTNDDRVLFRVNEQELPASVCAESVAGHDTTE